LQLNESRIACDDRAVTAEPNFSTTQDSAAAIRSQTCILGFDPGRPGALAFLFPPRTFPFWRVAIFNDEAQLEVVDLIKGDSASFVGRLSAGIYQRPGAEPCFVEPDGRAGVGAEKAQGGGRAVCRREG
jgi:hypothetical protein